MLNLLAADIRFSGITSSLTATVKHPNGFNVENVENPKRGAAAFLRETFPSSWLKCFFEPGDEGWRGRKTERRRREKRD